MNPAALPTHLCSCSPLSLQAPPQIPFLIPLALQRSLGEWVVSWQVLAMSSVGKIEEGVIFMLLWIHSVDHSASYGDTHLTDHKKCFDIQGFDIQGADVLCLSV